MYTVIYVDDKNRKHYTVVDKTSLKFLFERFDYVEVINSPK